MPYEGETNINAILTSLAPKAQGDWAFVLLGQKDIDLLPTPLMTFREDEGITAIVPLGESSGLDVRFVCTRIDLQVHSSLSGVGLTALVTGALAARGIAANVVAANYHEYLFVPTDRSSEALEILSGLADPVRIRRASLQDLDRLVPLLDGYRVFYKQASDPLGARQFLEARMSASESVVFIAEVKGGAVGFTQMFPHFSSVALRRVWWLNDLFVSPEARKFGVGTKLLKHSVEFARRDGAVRVMLNTAIDNLTAQRVYETAGWERVDQFFQYRFDLA